MKRKKQLEYGHDGKTNEEQLADLQEQFISSSQPTIFNPFGQQQFHRTGLFMLDGLSKASIIFLAILAIVFCGLSIYHFFTSPKLTPTGFYYSSIEDIYYASETIAVGTVVEIINPNEKHDSSYSNYHVSLRESSLLKGAPSSENDGQTPYINVIQNKTDLNNQKINGLKKGKNIYYFAEVLL